MGQFDLFGSMDGTGAVGARRGVRRQGARRRVGPQAPARRRAGDARALRVRATRCTASSRCSPPRPTPRSRRSSRAPSPTGAQVTVGGILAGVNRRVNKNGEPWASAQLEDLAGGIEVLFFPRCYQVVGVDVAEDAIVLVKARVNRRDDRVSLIVERPRRARPDRRGSAGRRCKVSLRTRAVHPAAGVAKLKEVLAHHPGPVRGAPHAGQRQPHHRAAPRRRAEGHQQLRADGRPEGAARPGLPGLSAGEVRCLQASARPRPRPSGSPSDFL